MCDIMKSSEKEQFALARDGSVRVERQEGAERRLMRQGIPAQKGFMSCSNVV